MDLVCDWFGPFRRLDINSCEVRYPEDKFECRDGDSYDRRADLFLDHGVRRRLTINDRLDQWTDISFLILSGFATGASWLCYFHALQIGNINKVVPIDKSSTVLTVLLAFILLREPVSIAKGIGVVLIAIGTFLMIEKKVNANDHEEKGWFLYAIGLALIVAGTLAMLF